MGLLKVSERKHPNAKANLLSRIFLWWTSPMFWTAYKSDLLEEDLYDPLPENDSEKLGDRLEMKWNEETAKTSKKKSPSLPKAIVKTFGIRFFLYGAVIAIDNGICRTLIPYFLSKLVKHFTDGAEVSLHEAYLFAMLMVGALFFNVLLKNHYMLWCTCIGMRVRVACCSLVYRKILRLDKTSMGQTETGHILNLMSNDVSRFDLAGQYFHWIWVSIVHTIATAVWMWIFMGTSAFIGVAAIVLSTVPIQGYLGKIAAKLRRSIAGRTDYRMRLMNEIMAGIQVVKMYTWEKPFSALISIARKREIDVVTWTTYLRAVLLSAIVFSERIALFATLFSHWMFGYRVLPYQMFTLATYMNFLNVSLAIYYPMGVAAVAEAYASIQRLQEFLLMNEGKAPKSTATATPGNISLSHVYSQWTPEQYTLNDINLEISSGMLCGILGTVGSGKSSLLQVLLYELPITTGTVNIGGRVSYSSQEPWIFGATVRQNIIFGCPYDSEKYNEVVRVCELKRDFSLLPNGDKTIVGEKGTTLSGGQKARINLARAVYQEADIYLLDDPLSAVDAVVGKYLYDECICGYLGNKTRVLVTHQIKYLQNADQLIILKEGRIQTQGTVQQVILKEPSLAETFNCGNASEIYRAGYCQSIMKKTQALKLPKEKIEKVRKRSTIFLCRLNTVNDLISSGNTKGLDYWKYFRAGAGLYFMIFTFIMWVITQVLRSAADYWMSLWSETRSELPAAADIPYSNEVYISVYGILVLVCCIATIIRSILFFKICMRASIVLHDQMFGAILRTTMRFFNNNPPGTILNRFSRDVGAMDEQLPNALLWMTQLFFIVVGTFAVILASSYYLSPAAVLIWMVIIISVKFLIEAPKKLKALEARTRRPVYSHLSDTLNGLVTIRALNLQSTVQKLFHSQQNHNTSACFWFLSTSTALGFYLDSIVAIFVGLVTATFFFLGKENVTGSEFGLAVSQALGLTGLLQTGVLQLTEVVSHMTSVSRVLEYTLVEPEPVLELCREKPDSYGEIPPQWPTTGQIQFMNVNMRYSEHSVPVLKNLNFVLESKHKVAVVGRTGAGKSSLVAVLFRFVNIEGSVFIDGIDISGIGLHDLRKRISIIPQDPVLFSATVRYNLDPFSEFDDGALWSVLEEVKLKEAIESLDWELSEGGSNLSIGQKQLVCLARAILRNNPILVLDEATANVDPGTDQLIQSTIRRKFKDCTVLTIAHRLNTIIDSDKVLVMDAGSVLEYDHPYNLLLNEDGQFFKIVQETGEGTSKDLVAAAQMAYRRKIQATQKI